MGNVIKIDDGSEVFDIVNKRGELLGQFTFIPSDFDIVKRYEDVYKRQDKQALSAAAGGTSSGGSGGVTSGVITSKSAGSESISYASPSEMASGAKTWSAVYQAAGDEQATNKLLYDTAQVYLTGVRDNEGTPLLYAGF